jgi:hypothetical protein
MEDRQIYTDMVWLTMPRTDAVHASQGFKDRSKRAKAIKGRSFQARAAIGKIVFPEDDYEPWVARCIERLVSFPVGKDDTFDVMAAMCAAIDQTVRGVVAPPKKPKPKDRWDRAFKNADRRSSIPRWKLV